MDLLQMSMSAGLLVIAIVFIRAVGRDRLPKTAFLVSHYYYLPPPIVKVLLGIRSVLVESIGIATIAPNHIYYLYCKVQ